MAYQIILKKRFVSKLVKVLAYLEKEWSHKVAAAFLKKVDHRIQQLSGQPFTGVPSSAIKDIRAVLITRHNRLYYKVKGKKVIVLNMYDTRMGPKRKKF
ncbi:MAG TPA: type II toxin-antitoxin system RelE/ParE family toxin [Chitinophagaceae bacterium]|nr:type II toxin-antitoxin system RelE/ParE family toxin [Chitinophagaceae bacterium]